VGVVADPMDHSNATIWVLPAEQRDRSPGYDYCKTRVHTIEDLKVNASFSGPIVYFKDQANCNVNNISCNETWIDTSVLLNPVPGEKVLITFNISSQISPQETRFSDMISMEVCHFYSTIVTGYWQGTNDAIQIVADGEFDAFFTTKAFQSSRPGCPVLKTELSDDNITFTSDMTFQSITTKMNNITGIVTVL
jgi:hypothetical protein